MVRLHDIWGVVIPPSLGFRYNGFVYMYMLVFVCPIGSMYAIYGNIYHQYNIPQMLAYIPYMDPMGITYINGLMTVSPRYVEANKHGSFST